MRRIRSRSCWLTDEPRSFFCAYIRWSASRSAADASDASPGSVTDPIEARMSKPLPCSRRAAWHAARIGSRSAALDPQERAELVAAEPVGRPVRRDRAGERLAHPAEQQVALQMAEGVVVGLEAVEIAQEEDAAVACCPAARPGRGRAAACAG